MTNKNICGIYKITNIINEKVYIGQSINILRRWNEHIRELNKNLHVNKYLQSSWNKYGEENFKFEIVEECKIEELNEKEVYYINKYNSYRNGYNGTIGGDGHIVDKKNVYELDNKLNIVNIYDNVQTVAEYFGVSDTIIYNCCNGKIGRVKNRILVYEDDYKAYVTVNSKSDSPTVNKSYNFNIIYTKCFYDKIKDVSLFAKGALLEMSFHINNENILIINDKIPTVKDIQNLIGLQKTKTYSILNELENKNIIKRVKNGNNNMIYINPMYIANKNVKDGIIDIFK